MLLLSAYPGEKTEWKIQYVRDALNFILKLFSSDWIGIVHLHIYKRIIHGSSCALIGLSGAQDAPSTTLIR